MAELFEATLTSKGQVTLPSRLRAALGLKSGDRLIFKKHADGLVEIEASTGSLGDLRGVVREAPRQITGRDIASWLEESRAARWRDPSGS